MDQGLRSWVQSANDGRTDFPIQNLPYGAFRTADGVHLGTAIGDSILDLNLCASQGLVTPALSDPTLNVFMAEGPEVWRETRKAVIGLLRDDVREARDLLVPIANAEMVLPIVIGDYTDFYASIHHATRVGKLFRPENPLLPNYKWVPIAYHGRASSIVMSGTPVRRPHGQMRPDPNAPPVFGPSQRLDYELELGFFIGPGNSQGEPISAADASAHIFGVCLVNDWSARDIQSWEYQPLGPFLGKNFATTISPWIVTMEALASFQVPPVEHETLPYLAPAGSALDITLEVVLNGELLTRSNPRDLYWTPAQMVAHHTSNGCNLRPGDLLATGTISGEAVDSAGCLLELGRDFLKDGDEVVFRAYCERDGYVGLGFGECRGRVSS